MYYLSLCRGEQSLNTEHRTALCTPQHLPPPPPLLLRDPPELTATAVRHHIQLKHHCIALRHSQHSHLLRCC